MRYYELNDDVCGLRDFYTMSFVKNTKRFVCYAEILVDVPEKVYEKITECRYTCMECGLKEKYYMQVNCCFEI